ncbi:stromal interaction molecule 2-like [Salvelinus alpinus]|uniref:stromal interaction molecule 2-like n=1 Tax=Salvelinus alpinus TaxID=8036 RepID=UPI0039FCFCEE
MMLLLSPVLLLLFRGVLFEASQGIIQDSGYYHHNDPALGLTFAGQRTVFDSTDPCLVVSPPCMNEADRYSLEALRNIHREMDDDQDGGIEVEESVEFIMEDMKQQQTNKHSHLHREDQHITIEELWRGWKFSEVHNWTQDEVLRWLREFVELPQYENNFKDFRVNGNTLPRIAANEPSFLSGQLKILDQRDKQKLNIKALDVVLFGAPIRPPHNYMKDLLLLVSVMMGIGGCWFSQVQNKASKVHISKMMKDLESLQSAELSLRELQEQLEQAQEEKRNVAEEKQNLEEKMRDEIMGAQEEAHRLHRLRAGAVSQLSRLRYAEEELEQVRGALKKAEKDMMAYWSVPEALQLWLQLTHEVEVQYYNIKKHSAELQLNTAKEEAEKIKKKRSSLMGTFHVAHSSSLDDVDTKILEAKNALSEVTACLRERLHRWQQIERLCGFPLLRNSGLASLTATLYSDSNWVAMPRVSVPTFPSYHETIQGSLGDLMEESSAPVLVPPMKRSPRSRGSTSTVCRQRRSGHASSSSSSSSFSDPDILIPIHTTLPCFEEEEQIFINAQRRGDSQVIYSDRTPPVSRRSSEPSGTESPVRKISREELEASLDEATSKTSSKDEPDSSSADNTAPRKMQRVKSETSMDPAANAAAQKVLGRSMDPAANAAAQKVLGRSMDPAANAAAQKVLGRSMDPAANAAAQKVLGRSMDPAANAAAQKVLGRSMDPAANAAAQKVLGRSMDPAANAAAQKVLGRSMDPAANAAAQKVLGRSMDPAANAAAQKVLGRSMDPAANAAAQKVLGRSMDPAANAAAQKVLGRSMDPAANAAAQKVLGRSMDNVSRKRSLLSTDVIGVSPDTGSRQMMRESRGEVSFNNSMRGRPREETVAAIGTPTRRISREEVDLVADSAQRRMAMSRDKLTLHLDSNSSHKMIRRKIEFPVEPPSAATRKISIDEHHEMCSHTRRRTNSDEIDRSIDTPTGKIYPDRVDRDPETPKQRISREEYAESSQVGHGPQVLDCGQFAQPDLTLSTPWKQTPTPDPYTSDHLTELVYDGILEKSCITPATTPDLPQRITEGGEREGNPPVPPPRSGRSLNTLPPEMRGERHQKDKDKSAKSSKLKNLFKKRKDHTPERPQGGLNNL